MFIYKRRKRRIIILIIFILILFLFYFFFLQLKTAFLTISKSKIYGISLQTINTIVSQKMSEIDYNDLITYQKNENDEINMVNTNIVLLNSLSNEISNSIINELEAIPTINIDIPIGSITGNELFAASGPTITFKTIPISEVKTEFKTDFYSTGINQTTHKIFLNVYCNVEALSKFMTNDVNITLQIPILETVLIGGVPNTYYQIDGVNKENMLNIIN